MVDIRLGRVDVDWRAATVLTFAQAGVTSLPIPGQSVTLYDGVNTAPGMIYAVHYGEETVTVAPDFDGYDKGVS